MTEAEPKIKRKITQRWWFPTVVVVAVLLALTLVPEGLWQRGQEAICGARDFFVKASGDTPGACP